MAANPTQIEGLLQEDRRFPPPKEFAEQANVRDPDVYLKAARDPAGFWAGFAQELHWFKKWDQVLDWAPPFARWFVGGKLNVSYNCLDRHLDMGRGDKAALVWEGEPGDSKTYTYSELHLEVCRFANALKSLGVGKGDTVAIYLPMVPELPIALLACARIGAPHNAIFSGFGPEALKHRVDESGAKVLITADGAYRGGKVVPLKSNADAALETASPVEKVVVVRRTGDVDGLMRTGRDVWWHDLVSGLSTECEPEPMDSEDTLFLLYTSGTTGKPKGVVHTTAGYLLGTYATAKWVFDLKEDDVHWCTADIAGVTGHSYSVYGPLANGVTTVMYEGAPDCPDRDRYWSIVEKYRVTVFYTHPTVVRSFVRWGESYPESHDLSSLRLLGSVGEPINPEAWMWYWQKIGGGKCPVVNTWWQTETGMIMIAPLPGITDLKPGSAAKPFPGVEVEVVDDEGIAVKPGQTGYLVVKKPWPAMFRTTHGDAVAYQDNYWSRFPNCYYPGDASKVDEDGYLWLLGRVDDLIDAPGSRISTMEAESALVNHPAVAEAAVIGKKQETERETVIAFVTLKEGVDSSDGLKEELKAHVNGKLGAAATPQEIVFAPELPKTISGKIMRRLLRDTVEGRDLGDITSLADLGVIQALAEDYRQHSPEQAMSPKNSGKPQAGGIVAWFTGLSGAGKSSIAARAEELLAVRGLRVLTLDGDNVRATLYPRLGFSIEDIYENNRRFVALCQDSIDEYDVILVPKISPFLEQRTIARRELGESYVEVYVQASLDEVTRRDTKGLYRDAQEGKLSGMVGVAPEVPYEPPKTAELVLDTETFNLEDCAGQLADFLLERSHQG